MEIATTSTAVSITNAISENEVLQMHTYLFSSPAPPALHATTKTVLVFSLNIY